MTQSTQLIDVLKKSLKARGFTYAKVAKELRMSEANVKRMFATKRFTLKRLEDVCRLLQMELTDLIDAYSQSVVNVTQLTVEQERELVRDVKLLFFAISVRNRLSYDDIVTQYKIPNTECIRYLAKLDRLKIIELLPGNRIKLRIGKDFRWLPNGPIEHFFEDQVQKQFLNSKFHRENESRLFIFGFLSDASIQLMLSKIQATAREFTELQRQDEALPMTKRRNVAMLLAMRPWELEMFGHLRRPARK